MRCAAHVFVIATLCVLTGCGGYFFRAKNAQTVSYTELEKLAESQKYFDYMGCDSSFEYFYFKGKGGYRVARSELSIGAFEVGGKTDPWLMEAKRLKQWRARPRHDAQRPSDRGRT